MSYESWRDGGLTPLEREAGLWGIIYGNDDGTCSCGKCEECESRHSASVEKRQSELRNSSRYKVAAKLVAGLTGNRAIKLALVKKVHQDSIDTAIVRYMAEEALPKYYAAILKSPNCIDRLIEGVLCKVCKLRAENTLSEQIVELRRLMHRNPNRLTAYDRVTLMQQFIHQTADYHLGVGAALSIPVQPMKNALSAARLHLGIFDVIDQRPGYLVYIDSVSSAAMQLEYDEPRQSTAPLGKRTWPRWRVRHLRPLSYYFSMKSLSLLRSLQRLDERMPVDEFVNGALEIYADA